MTFDVMPLSKRTVSVMECAELLIERTQRQREQYDRVLDLDHDAAAVAVVQAEDPGGWIKLVEGNAEKC